MIKKVQIKDGAITVEKENGEKEQFNETSLMRLLNGFTDFVQTTLGGDAS